MNNLVCHHFRALIVSANGYVGNLFIQRITFTGQRFQNFARRGFNLQQRTLFIALGTSQLFFDGCLKVNHDAASGETVTGFARFYRAAAGCQNNALLLGEFIDDFFFSVTEAFFALNVEDPTYISAGSFLNLLIRIVKFHIELLS